MAEAVGAVRIDLFANLAQWVSGLDKAEGRLNRFAKNTERTSKNIISAGQKLTIGLTAPIAAFAGLSIRAAAEAQDLQGAFNIAFGTMADDATMWAEKTGNALGRSTQTIQKTAIGFQQLFEDIAPTEQAAAELSQRFTELSEDYASFANVTSDQAFQVLSGGLAGAGKALKRLGIDISDGALQQEAMRLGIAKANVELTNQQKVLARASIIQAGFAKQTGEIARSQGEAEEDTRRTREEFDELLVTVGQDLLPIFNQLLGGLRDVIRFFNGLSKETRAVIGVTAAFVAAVGPAVFIVGNLVKVVGLASVAFSKLGFSFLGVGKSAGTMAGQVAGATLRFAALAAASYGLGSAIGSLIDSMDLGGDSKAIRDMGDALKEAGYSGETGRAALKYFFDEMKKGNRLSTQAVLDYAKFASQFNAVAMEGAKTADEINNVGDATANADQGISDLIKSMGDLGGETKKTGDDFASLRAKVDPIGEALKTYKAEVAQAVKLGYDLSTVQAVIGKEFVAGLSSVDGFRAALSTLPPEIQKIVAAQDALAIRQNTFADNWKKLAEQREADKQLAEDSAKAAQDSIDNIRDYGAALTQQFDPMAVYAQRMQGINDAFRLGAIDANVYAKAKAAAFAETDAGALQVKTVEDLSTAFTDAAMNAGNLGDSIMQMIQDALRAQVIKPFFDNLFSGLFPQTQALTAGTPGGGFDLGSIVSSIGSFFGGTRDKGGDARPGMSYTIGSGVRETFTPDVPGTITRDGGRGGGTQIFNIEAKDPNAFRNSERQIKRRMKQDNG